MPIGSVGKGEKGGKGSAASAALALLAGVVFLAAACDSASSASSGPVTLRLGYFPNITQGTALVGVQERIFANALSPDKLDASKTFNAGPAEATALISGAIDVAFIGPSPSINAFTRSNGAVRIVSGAASGGAGLVVKPSITSVDELKGKTLATPQLGNTQDVALRSFLKSHGFKTDLQGGGDVHINPQDNSQTLLTFKQGSIDGAWVPEPYLSQMVVQDGGRLLVDEKQLWPNGQWDTTDVLISTSFLEAHPATVRRFLEGLVETAASIKSDPTTAKTAMNQQLASLSGKKLPDSVLNAAFANLTFTVDPIASSLVKQASDAVSAGLLTSPKLRGIFDLTILNQVLNEKGEAQVASS
jgi:NitT/TauT family transport system substrate-binding protein